MAQHIYTEREVTALLERAAALQQHSARQDEARPGLTLPEIEAIAAEAGLDPSLLRQAARELDAPASPNHGAPPGTTATHVFVERWVPGTLSEEAWEDVVAELRHRYDTDLGAMMGMPGYGRSLTERIGRSVEWRHTSMAGIETRVMIRPRGEGLHVRLSQRVGWGSPLAESLVYGLFGGLLGLVPAALLDAGKAFAVALMGVLYVLAVAGIFAADRAWRRNKHRALEALGDRVAALLTAHEAPAQPVAETAPTANVSDPADAPLVLDDDAPMEGAAPHRPRTRA